MCSCVAGSASSNLMLYYVNGTYNRCQAITSEMWQLELLVVSEWVCRVLDCNIHSQQLLQRLKERNCFHQQSGQLLMK